MEIQESLPRRYYELDSIRGLAALSVFFSHCLLMVTISGHFGVLGDVLENSILHIFWDGGAAVILFFVLSGFVLTLPYVGDIPKAIDIIPFIIRRVFRIYPAYFFALILTVLFKQLIFVPGQLTDFSWIANDFWQWKLSDITWTIVKNHLVMVGPDLTRLQMGIFIPVIWSLVVEMQVSLIFPFIIPLISKMNKWWKAILFFMVSFLISYILFIKLNMEFLRYMPLFILGGLLAKFKTELTQIVIKLSLGLKVLVGILALILYTFRFSIYQPFLERYDFSFGRFYVFGRSLGFISIDCIIDYIIGFGVTIIIIYAISLVRLSQILHIKPIKFLGDVSYSFYLLHLPVLLAISSVIYPFFHSIVLAWIVSLVITSFISYVSFRIIEKPFQNIGRVISKKVRFTDFLKKKNIKTNPYISQ